MEASRRRCYVCKKKDCACRRFLLPGEPDRPPPQCPDGHGPMRLEQNRPYKQRESR